MFDTAREDVDSVVPAAPRSLRAVVLNPESAHRNTWHVGVLRLSPCWTGEDGSLFSREVIRKELRQDARWSLVVPTSMGVRITPEDRQPVHIG
ncbi:MAG: hypothetical protein IPG68_11970 [Micrococcales bacterium]|nr:hypothetical protein [Micrococcales bacterium]